jgi:methyl-accepting chemotaxis protein
VATGLTSFAGTMDVMSSMLSLDFSSAAGMVQPFEDNYATLLEVFETLVKAETLSAQSRAAATERTVRWSIGLMLGLTLLVGAANLWLQNRLASSVTEGIALIAQATDCLSKEDLSVDLDRLARTDELQSIVRGLRVFRDNIRRVQELAAAQTEAQAGRATMLRTLAQDFDNKVQGDIARSTEAARLMRTKASELSERMGHNRAASQISDTAAERVSGNVQNVASAIEAFSAATKQIARQADLSSDRMNATLVATETAQGRVSVLQEAAQKIGAIVQLIADIAAQTNLLALNRCGGRRGKKSCQSNRESNRGNSRTDRCHPE